jgi:membrane fusion protein, multidrug efflux system
VGTEDSKPAAKETVDAGAPPPAAPPPPPLTPDETGGETPKDPWILRWGGRAIGLAIVVCSILASIHVYREVFRYPRTDDAYVRANFIGIAPHVSGPIVELNIVDNAFIREGEVLFVVDPRPYEAALAEAEAQLALTDLEITAYERAVQAAQATIERRQAQAAYDVDYLQRLAPLLKGQFVTPDQVALAESQARASEAAVAESKAEKLRAISVLGDVDNSNARREAAEAAVVNAKLNLSYCIVRAPFDGWVTNLNIAVGEYANQGQEVFALVDNSRWYVMANFKETYLDSIKTGMRVKVYLIAYPGKQFTGTVQGIGWALFQQNGATVGVLPAVEPTLNWVRLAQRFPVRIILDDPDPNFPYRMGATAVVTIKGDKSAQAARALR